MRRSTYDFSAHLKCRVRVTQGCKNWKIMLTWHLGLNQPLWHSEWDCWWRMFNSPCMENGLQILPNDLKLYGIWFTILLIDIKILGDRDFYSLLIWFKNLWTFFLSVYSQQRGVALEYQDRDRKLEKPPQKLTPLVLKKNYTWPEFQNPIWSVFGRKGFTRGICCY